MVLTIPAAVSREPGFVLISPVQSSLVMFISYDRIEPIGPLLAVAADIQYAITSGQLEEDRAQYLVGYMANSIAINLTDKIDLPRTCPMAELMNPGNKSPEMFIAKIS